jgi:hypothetical protein
MNLADAAERVLKESEVPLSIFEITERALHQGLITPKSDTPAVYVRAAIRKDNRKRESRGEPLRFTLKSRDMFGPS